MIGQSHRHVKPIGFVANANFGWYSTGIPSAGLLGLLRQPHSLTSQWRNPMAQKVLTTTVGKSTTPTAQYSCHVRGVELFSIIQLYYLIVYIVSTCITCITCTDWWVSSILKRAPIHPSISKL